MQMGGADAFSNQEERLVVQSIAIEWRGVLRYC